MLQPSKSGACDEAGPFPVKGLAVAASFLTRIPIPVRIHGPADLARSIPWFAVVGAGVGSLVGLVLGSAGGVLPVMAAAALAVAAELVLTGAFHHDGLADSFDAVGAGRDRIRALEIMKDSQLGTFGVSALAVSILLRVGLYSALVASGPVVTLAALGGLSRGLAVGVLAILPSVGPGGLGTSYTYEMRRHEPILAVVVGTVIGFGLLGADLLLPFLAAIAGVALVASWAHMRLGGVTGDILGACQQVGELAGLVVLVALLA